MRHRPSPPFHPLLTFGLACAFALCLVAVTVACAPEGAETQEAAEPAEDGSEPSDYADRMAEEHAGDEPVASGSAEGAPGTAVDGESVAYATIDGTEVTGYLARPEGADGPLPALVVIHEWWGLNDNIRQMTDRLAGEGYAALAVDLYGGETAESPETARELVSAVDRATALDNLAQALGYLEDRGANEIGVIGWCFGGGKSLELALAEPGRVDAAVVYYGQPITEAAELEALEAPLLGIFGAEDGGIPVDAVREMEATLDELGKNATIHVYEGAGHAFANPSGTRYVPEAADDAWAKTLDFFTRHLAGESN